MKKRLIIDVDNTLIPWDKKYYLMLKKILKQNNIKLSWIRFYKMLKEIESYDHSHNCWNMEELKECITEVTKIEMDDDKVNLIFEWLENCVIGVASKELHDTLKYLSKKYELVILSNSFKKAQEKRLEKYGIRKYFKEIYCGDEVMKPNKEAYIKACGKYKPTECMMIGDSLEFDVIAPSKLGISPIYVSKKKNKEYMTVKNVIELKEIL